MELKYHKHTLPNGIRVFMVPKKETRAVFIEVLIGVGSRYESREMNGIAHFLEHMNGRGTKKRPTMEIISKEIDQVGGAENAFTAKELTGGWVRVPYEKIALGIDLLSDTIFNSQYKNEDIKKEKAIIAEEIKMYIDDPRSFANEEFEKIVYGNTSLGRNVLGTAESISKINREKLIKFKKRFYNPNNIVIAIGGKFQEKEALRLLKKHFSKIKGKTKDAYEQNANKQVKAKVAVYKRDIKQCNLIIGFRSFGLERAPYDRKVRAILSKILGGYASSKLFHEVREKRGLVYYIYSGNDNFRDTGCFYIGAGLDKSKVPEAMKAIFKILKDAKNKGFSAEELKRAKENTTGRISLSLDGAAGWAEGLASDVIFDQKIETPDETIKEFNKVTNSDLKKMAREVFRPENFNMVVVGPIDKKEEKKYINLIKL